LAVAIAASIGGRARLGLPALVRVGRSGRGLRPSLYATVATALTPSLTTATLAATSVYIALASNACDSSPVSSAVAAAALASYTVATAIATSTVAATAIPATTLTLNFSVAPTAFAPTATSLLGATSESTAALAERVSSANALAVATTASAVMCPVLC